MNQIFPGKTTEYVSRHNGSELPCQISRKSLERFLRKIINQPTNGSDLMGPGDMVAGPTVKRLTFVNIFYFVLSVKGHIQIYCRFSCSCN